MDSNKVDDSKNTNAINTDLNKLYNRYFVYPENIDAVYNTPDKQLRIKLLGEFMYDKTHTNIHAKEQIIRDTCYWLPNLSLPGFFVLKDVRADLLPKRKNEIEGIFHAADMILSDIDSVKDIHTKKCMLYYFGCLANATKDYDFGKNISSLVIRAAKRNNIAIPANLIAECLGNSVVK